MADKIKENAGWVKHDASKKGDKQNQTKALVLTLL